jgi:hypothetical protein
VKVLARFWVQSVKKSAASGGDVTREVILQPVIRAGGLPGAEGNVNWSKYTPSGEIRLVVTADAAGTWFEERIAKDIAIEFSDPLDN